MSAYNMASYTEERGASMKPSRAADVSFRRRPKLDLDEKRVFGNVIKSTLSKPKDVRKATRNILSRSSYVLTLRAGYGRFVSAA